MNEKKFDYKQLKATERVVEINQILNGAEGPELKNFGFHLQNMRKKIMEEMKQENEDEDYLIKELEEYLDTYYVNQPKQSNIKGKFEDQSSHWGQSKSSDIHKLQKKHHMMQQYLHTNRQGEMLEINESKKDFKDLKRILGLGNLGHH